MKLADRSIWESSVLKTKFLIQAVFRRFGYEIHRTQPRLSQNLPIPNQGKKSGVRLYVGCGENHRDGFIGCDIRPLPTVSVVCKAWEVSQYCKDVLEIYSRNLLECLTFGEVSATLDDWFQALCLGGKVHIVVPNIDYYIRRVLEAEFSEEALRDKWSDARWSFAGLYGWQSECYPQQNKYNTAHWDVHKSGYNVDLLSFLLREAGFSGVRVNVVDKCELVALATKKVSKGERQVAPSVEGIRLDHRARYEFAVKFSREGSKVLDAACGVGYGAKIIADMSPAVEIVAVDIDEGAIEYARENYQTPKIQFQLGDATQLELPTEYFDLAISFETVEHIKDHRKLLKRFYQVLKPSGTLIISTPNETTLPFSQEQFPYHIRHYIPEEFKRILQESGFTLLEWYTQHDSNSGVIHKGWDGKYNIAVCEKR